MLYNNPPVPVISQQEALDRRMFGPVWHGTTPETQALIDEDGFKFFVTDAHEGPTRHGFRGDMTYHDDIPPPVHFLGYGVYFTTVNALAKSYGAVKGTYYLDVPRLETINFGAPRTMMKWWVANGYDPALAKVDRVAATVAFTEYLKAQWDAVWFKGKALRRLLDADQVVVFDPANIYRIDAKLARPFEVGSTVKRNADGMRGTVLKSESLDSILERCPGASCWAAAPMALGAKRRLTVRWRKGGTDFQVIDIEVTPVEPRK